MTWKKAGPGGAGKGATLKRPQPKVLQNLKSWKPGECGNREGRAPGSKNKLSKAFVEALCHDFERYGARAIARCRHKMPDAYLRTIAYILPKDVNVRHGFEDFSEDQLEPAAGRLRDLLATVDARPRLGAE